MSAESVEEDLRAWLGIYPSKERREMICLILLASFRLIWRDRNRRIFDNDESHFGKFWILGFLL